MDREAIRITKHCRERFAERFPQLAGEQIEASIRRMLREAIVVRSEPDGRSGDERMRLRHKPSGLIFVIADVRTSIPTAVTVFVPIPYAANTGLQRPGRGDGYQTGKQKKYGKKLSAWREKQRRRRDEA